MKKLFGRIAARFRQPKWRHGKLGALLTAGFLLICVLVNVAVTTLEETYGWRRDMSFNGYATTGEETKEALDALQSDVTLYLLYQSGNEDTQILQLLKRYEVLSPRVRVVETDIAQNPGILSRFEGDTETTPEADSVIVHCEDTGRYRILDYYDFMVQGYDVDAGAFTLEGMAYEKSLTEAIQYVTQEHVPTVGVLQGHGEMSMTAMQTLLDFLNSNSYDTREVTLKTEDALEGIDLLLIFSPQKDLSETETQQINAFAKNGGSLFVTRDYTDPIDGMPNYMALLRSYGVTPLPGVVVDPGGYHESPVSIVPYMEELDMTMSLLANGLDVLLMPTACAFETPGEPTSSLTTGTVLKTSNQAYLRDVSDGNDSIEKQAGDRTGELSVAQFAHRMHANGNISRLFIAGSSALFTAEYVYQRTFVQQFLLMLLGELTPSRSVSLDHLVTAALRPALTVGSRSLGVALVVAAPLLVLIAGLIVLLPRRNR